ncbi:transmembrane protein 200C [Osmerus eperlanus]|uniref:transmembrane protein 200C n=1 Tax=Osmerus eperlanus TaxID=29151 RepID=UPI002E11A330
MIATGGLLRINARRQDSLRSKTRAENRRKRKARKKRRNEVVVVQGKLQLCSLSGLVAAVGLVILLVGVAMAILGYWPRDSLLYPGPTRVAAVGQELVNRSTGFTGANGTNSVQAPRSFLEEFMDKYLYSDMLKVLGPLIMGIGIFLFICANAVLHEDRDKKTKIINLRDIYSTVIDVHSLRKECSPLNGFVNYVQSKGLEGKSSAAYAAALLARTSWPQGGAEHGGGQEEEGQGSPSGSSLTRLGGTEMEKPHFTDPVYSICQEHGLAPPTPPRQPPPSPPPSSVSSPPSPSPRQWDSVISAAPSVHSFTLPLTRSSRRSSQHHQRRPSARAETGRGNRAGLGGLGGAGGDGEGKVQTGRTQDWVEVSRSSCSLTGVTQGSQAQLLSSSPDQTHRPTASHLSLSASPPSGHAVDCSRRLSCPRLDSYSCTGYTKLGSMGGESFESSEVATFSHMTVLDRGQRSLEAGDEEESHAGSEASEGAGKRKFSNKEKLQMISRTDSGLDQSQEVECLGQEGEGPGT